MHKYEDKIYKNLLTFFIKIESTNNLIKRSKNLGRDNLIK